MAFEKKTEPLATRRRFFARMALSFCATLGVIAVSLLLGAIGYHAFGPKMSWIDALHNASMILTGMGPVDKMESDSGKLFATFYALYSGIAFLTIMAIMAAPVFHRILHKFHLDDEENDEDQQKEKRKRKG